MVKNILTIATMLEASANCHKPHSMRFLSDWFVVWFFMVRYLNPVLPIVV